MRDATYLLDGILDNETELNILEHTTDTAGYTDVMFALFDVLGLRFSPRIRDVGKKSLYLLNKDFSYANLEVILKGCDLHLITRYCVSVLSFVNSDYNPWANSTKGILGKDFANLRRYQIKVAPFSRVIISIRV